MSYCTQVTLVLTPEGEESLRTGIANVASDALRSELRSLLDQDARRIEGTHHRQTLYFWDWMKWYPNIDGSVSWLEEALDAIPPREYVLRRLGEDEGDHDLQGDLDEHFGIRVRRFIDFNPEPDHAVESRTAHERLVEGAWLLAAAYDEGAATGHMEWEQIDEVEALVRPTLQLIDRRT